MKHKMHRKGKFHGKHGRKRGKSQKTYKMSRGGYRL